MLRPRFTILCAQNSISCEQDITHYHILINLWERDRMAASSPIFSLPLIIINKYDDVILSYALWKWDGARGGGGIFRCSFACWRDKLSLCQLIGGGSPSGQTFRSMNRFPLSKYKHGSQRKDLICTEWPGNTYEWRRCEKVYVGRIKNKKKHLIHSFKSVTPK